jgi:hypothetical protein
MSRYLSESSWLFKWDQLAVAIIFPALFLPLFTVPIGLIVGLILGIFHSWQLGLWVGGGIALGPLVLGIGIIVIGTLLVLTLEQIVAVCRWIINHGPPSPPAPSIYLPQRESDSGSSSSI